MRVVIQKVKRSSVSVDGKVTGEIGKGLMVLFAVHATESIEDAVTLKEMDWLVQKIVNLRIFEDGDGVMNRSVLDEDGEILVVSQFTLYAKTKKGNRPSYIESAKGDVATPLYEEFVRRLSVAINKPVPTGVFGADMEVTIINDGPTTIVMDTLNKDL
ncbi:MAG: D-aminoacyl-tRNA deacylase [Bacteroidales bacterium]|nr:D-aminoacyl-tRNA deacylase [Bacteroidales bacterium]